MRLILKTLFLTLLSAHICLADNRDQAGTEIEFTQVIPAQAIINQRVEDRYGVLVGTVSDIVIDRQNGRVAYFAVNSRRARNTRASNYLLPPDVVGRWTPDGRLHLDIPYEKVEHVGDIVKPVPMNSMDSRSLRKIYEEYGVKPYWSEDGQDLADTLYLVTVDELDGRIIRDADWHKLARVEEVLLAPHNAWKVAYIALDELDGQDDADRRIAVPMSAFARRTLSPTWLLDVPLEAELLQKTFAPGEWPTEIDRGWIEFSHVKYGTSALGGLVDLRDEDER